MKGYTIRFEMSGQTWHRTQLLKSYDHNYSFFEKNEKNEKCLELPDLARKCIRKIF
jgi:hypothetical protein